MTAADDRTVVLAATDRVQRAMADLGRLDLRALSRLSLSLDDAEDRALDREVAVRAAERAGLGLLLRDARAEARDYVTRAFDQGGFLAIGVDLGESRSRASTDDRVAVMVAAEDDVTAAVAAPFISVDVRQALTTPMDRLHPARGGAYEMPRTALDDPIDAERRLQRSRVTGVVGTIALVLASLLLLAIGSDVGLVGLGGAVAIVLVALVLRGRILP